MIHLYQLMLRFARGPCVSFAEQPGFKDKKGLFGAFTALGLEERQADPM